MKQPPAIGSSGKTTWTVSIAQTIEFPGLPPILATPWLIGALEEAALQHLQPSLDDGEISVGTHVDLEHRAPIGVGAVVTCQARVIHVDGPVVTFQVEASDGRQILSRGLHRRRVVAASRLARRLNPPAP